jgi:hypothetical protein
MKLEKERPSLEQVAVMIHSFRHSDCWEGYGRKPQESEFEVSSHYESGGTARTTKTSLSLAGLWAKI